MRLPAVGGPLRWCSETALGLYRSAVLVGLTGVIPAVGLVVGLGGSEVAYSWSDGSTASWFVRALAALGETLMVIVWIAVAAWITHLLVSRTLSQAARQRAEHWLGMRIQAEYRPVPPITRMATGYWWDGKEYHRSEREARRRARMNARFHDPQLQWDGLWAVVAAGAVLPVAALPLVGLVGGLYMTLASGLVGYGIAVMAASLVGAPFAWRIFGPLAARFLGPAPRSLLGRRVEELEAIRADLTQTQAAELERIERGLHDGAQARLVAMGMSMGAAEQLVDTDPEAAKRILADARATSATALAELRSLVRGINPPVLAERGLVDAVRALALDAPVEVTVNSAVPSRPERPVESAVYFAVAELLANVAKHAQASEVTVELGYAKETLTATVTDDGVGGAAASEGSGLSGIERRMTAFGGCLEIESPTGGPTHITVAVPCALS
ncbi:signal transduction histidine kinase [Streptomyces griseochromogenes]|uniref:histidine kinase n=1 Tax=Streptomyces griseochromogenes TaxID=68214 RepID=A0A1B1ATM3_9ACTN|nr:sensor histidine kinase [Streptomyces griseochromogenes]ANP49929.1 two-component sensor histidine kinase [Streptomyces griseochromogenes]MBP2048487.1 signal transduction histidine kinase [Streptomyces griseochromogenes]